ncbi:MAG TPA: DUF4261 domain-containing protein [Longimicrobium sp.]|nr:DUF4261 domain-containing protein [Longimicrobium sp.]
MSQLVVGVPGPWESRTALMEALIGAKGGAYLFAGQIFMEVETKRSCEIGLYEHDDQLRRAFEFAGGGALPGPLLNAIGAHRITVYLIFNEPGYESARDAVRFVNALLEAGGIAVKVESAGAAHTAERWRELGASEDAFDTYTLFVQLVGGDDRFFSCGMHNFALPDAAVPSTLGPQDGANLLNAFNFYRLMEQPELKDGETFSVDADAPRFRLKSEPYEAGYEPDEPLYNPHGLWSLLPADNPPAKKRWRWSFRG